ncbi:unnamed protein product [Polarella glacialis]|uniref:Uncharacterized protein n=1 Tax=Polarella glacialis TaxID=89957 RepID=A0A813G018_POLGL|nr:unnamed protein product [Polarella glacialis]
MVLSPFQQVALGEFALKLVLAKVRAGPEGNKGTVEEDLEDALFRFGASSHQMAVCAEVEAASQSRHAKHRRCSVENESDDHVSGEEVAKLAQSSIQGRAEPGEPVGAGSYSLEVGAEEVQQSDAATDLEASSTPERTQMAMPATVPTGPVTLSDISRVWVLRWARMALAQAMPSSQSQGQECWFQVAAVLDHLMSIPAAAERLGLMDGDHVGLQVTSLAIASMVAKIESAQTKTGYLQSLAGDRAPQILIREREMLQVLHWHVQRPATLSFWVSIFRNRLAALGGTDSALVYLCSRTLSFAEHLVLQSRAGAGLLPSQRLASALLVGSFRHSGLLSLELPEKPEPRRFPATTEAKSSASGISDPAWLSQCLLEQLSWVTGVGITQLCVDVQTVDSTQQAAHQALSVHALYSVLRGGILLVCFGVAFCLFPPALQSLAAVACTAPVRGALLSLFGCAHWCSHAVSMGCEKCGSYCCGFHSDAWLTITASHLSKSESLQRRFIKIYDFYLQSSVR